MPWKFSPLFSYPGMHHGTFVTHVRWYMSESLIRGGGENVHGIPGTCATLNFTYLARGPWGWPPTANCRWADCVEIPFDLILVISKVGSVIMSIYESCYKEKLCIVWEQFTTWYMHYHIKGYHISLSICSYSTVVFYWFVSWQLHLLITSSYCVFMHGLGKSSNYL